MEKTKRIGKFSSSDIYRLMKKGVGDKPSVDTLSYVREKQAEIFFDRSLNEGGKSRACTWGLACEAFLGESGALPGWTQETYVHEELPWCGSPDMFDKDVLNVGDCKAPMTLKNAYELIRIKEEIELKRCRPEYYWQLMSNAALTGAKVCTLLVWVPDARDFERLRQFVASNDFDDPLANPLGINFNDLQFISYLDESELPIIGKTITHKIQWTPDEDDLTMLEERIKFYAPMLGKKEQNGL
jgi:hypothetical protein